MAMPFIPGAISQYPSTADSPGLSRTLPLEVMVSGLRAAGGFSGLGADEDETFGFGAESAVLTTGDAFG
jgi:hypothetical protein